MPFFDDKLYTDYNVLIEDFHKKNHRSRRDEKIITDKEYNGVNQCQKRSVSIYSQHHLRRS